MNVGNVGKMISFDLPRGMGTSQGWKVVLWQGKASLSALRQAKRAYITIFVINGTLRMAYRWMRGIISLEELFLGYLFIEDAYVNADS